MRGGSYQSKKSLIANHMSSMEDFMDQIDRQMTRIQEGEFVDGTIIQVSSEEILVNIGYSADGLLTRGEVRLKKGETLMDKYTVGDSINVAILKLNDGEGNVLLTQKKVDFDAAWDEIERHHQNDKEITAFTTEAVKGGVRVDINGIYGFMPASQLSLEYIEDLTPFVEEEYSVKIIECNRQDKKLIVSRKVILQAEKHASAEEFFKTVNVGEILKGKVVRIEKYGAFINVGAVDGLLHISNMSWRMVRDPKEVVSLGQELNVEVLNIDPATEKIGFRLSQMSTDPWKAINENYKVDDIIECEVVKTIPQGVFVNLDDSLDGFVPISELSEEHVKNTRDVVTEGDLVWAKIIRIDPQNKRLTLSLKNVDDEGEDDYESYLEEEQTGSTLGDLFKDKLAGFKK